MKKCPKCGDDHNKSGLFCSRHCANSRTWSDEDKENKSIAALNSEKVKAANEKLNKEKIISICLKCGKEIKSRVDRKYHNECWRKSSGGLRVNSTIKHRSIYNGFQMDSGAERIFAILLDENNIKWVKNSTQFFEYINIKGKKSKYYPDFYLPELNQWIEIKGKFYADKDKNLDLKLKAVPNIKIIYSKELALCKRNIKGLLV